MSNINSSVVGSGNIIHGVVGSFDGNSGNHGSFNGNNGNSGNHGSFNGNNGNHGPDHAIQLTTASEVCVNGQTFVQSADMPIKYEITIKEISGDDDEGKSFVVGPDISFVIKGNCQLVHTDNGNIHVEGGLGQVSTHNGNVTCGGIDGSVKTFNGSVCVYGDILGDVSTYNGPVSTHKRKI